jgi:hypothetical protein
MSVAPPADQDRIMTEERRHLYHRVSHGRWRVAGDQLVGFVLGYGVREWVFRRYRRAEQRRRRPF